MFRAQEWASARKGPLAAVAAIVVLSLLMSGGEVGAPSLFQLMLVAGLLLAWLPVVIAAQRKHHRMGIIVLLSALGIVPVVGWVTWTLALVMAAAMPAEDPRDVRALVGVR